MAGLLVAVFTITPTFAVAQTSQELLAEIARLRAILQELTARVNALRGNQVAWCHVFNRNLGRGATGEEVTALQTALQKEGLYSGAISDVYDDATAQAVAAFQNKYRAQVLSPLGLVNSTTFFGPSTRARMNGLYQCQPRPYPDNLPPVISGVSGPTRLQVGEQGTWTVTANDPKNGNLYYSVLWGDEVPTLLPVADIPASLPVQQTSTLTHTYRTAHNYTPTFTVKDMQGQLARTSISVEVRDSSTRDITVLTPNGGEEWDIGKRYSIKFNMPLSSISGVTPESVFHIRANGPTPFFIAENEPVTSIQEYDFTVPVSQSSPAPLFRPFFIQPGDYQIKFFVSSSFIGGGDIIIPGVYQPRTLAEATSNGLISIRDQDLAVLSPNSGEEWEANSVETISWRYDGATSQDKVDLWLHPQSCDNNMCFQLSYWPTLLDQNIPASGVYNWIVATDIDNNPIVPGRYLIVVCRAGASTAPADRPIPTWGDCDSSDLAFTIIP